LTFSKRLQLVLLAAAPFVVLCTMNAAGYRYGASDHALYIPAVLRHVDPAFFPRDAQLIDTQARLMLNDEVIAALLRITGSSLQHLFIVLYVLTLITLLAAAVRLGSGFYRTRAAVVALAAALTLRHAIAKTGANTLEGYFHPRQFAFALGLFAIAMFLERRDRLAIAFIAAAGVAHTTTVLWFAIWLTVALWFGRPSWRKGIGVCVGLAAVGVAWAMWAGPLAGRLVRMDGDWLAAIADKDYLFPTSWPADAWLTNLISVPIIIVAWRARVRSGLASERETAMVFGAFALVGVFCCWLPFDAAHLALAVQLQTSRVFWLLDVLGTIYLVWALAEGRLREPGRRAAAVAGLIVALSTERALYTCFVQFPDRRIFAVDVQNTDWREAMAWARQSPIGSGWLADPAHAALYGGSVRAIGERDVLIETIKDTALAMYDRGIAMAVAERRRAADELRWDTADGARALAARYRLDYLVTNRPVALPVAYRAGSLTIYSLR
jgi:hypothetical protein